MFEFMSGDKEKTSFNVHKLTEQTSYKGLSTTYIICTRLLSFRIQVIVVRCDSKKN